MTKSLAIRVVTICSLVMMGVAHGQTTPYCPTNAASIVFHRPGGGVIASDGPVAMGITQSFLQNGAAWQFIPQNITVLAFQITLDAPGVPTPNFPPIPLPPTVLGVLPAGTYNIVVRGIATNVTPNVVCPTFNVPLVVAQGAVETPVPSSNVYLLALLGLILAAVGSRVLRRGQAQARK